MKNINKEDLLKENSQGWAEMENTQFRARKFHVSEKVVR